MFSHNGRIQIQAIVKLFTVTRQVAPGDEVCYRPLPCYYKRGVVCGVGCNEVHCVVVVYRHIGGEEASVLGVGTNDQLYQGRAGPESDKAQQTERNERVGR